jgi:hypothetical protein
MTDAGAGSFALGEWDARGVARLTATGADPEQTLLAGLEGIAAAARGAIGPEAATAETGTTAAAIRGQGADLAALFAELANDLLAQLDANGPGLATVRLDGLLATDDGGWTAWGYAVGTPAPQPPPIGLSLDESPALDETPDGLVLRFALRRG